MSGSSFALWVYLSERPLTWLSLTLAAYAVADHLAARLGRMPLANPVLMAAGMIVLILWLTGTPYPIYFDGAQFVHFLLGPATVALAVPLYSHRRAVMTALLPICGALVVGSIVSIVAVVVILKLFGVPFPVVASMAPKAVTAAVAMAVSEGLGGDPALTAVLVITTGVFGAMTALPLLDRAGITDAPARGFAVGLVAHGIGTARVFQSSELSGTFAALAMALNAAFTAMVAPLILRWLGG